jgi:hypothetical protein
MLCDDEFNESYQNDGGHPSWGTPPRYRGDLIIFEQTRCPQLNDVGGCMIRGDCSKKTKDVRESVLCHCDEGLPKLPKTKRAVKAA